MLHYLKVFLSLFFISLVNQSFASTPLDYQVEDVHSTLSSVIGEQNVAVFLVNFEDNPVQPWTKAEAQDIVFKQTNNLVRELSYNQTSLKGIVIGYYTLPLSSSNSCYPSLNPISTLAISAALAEGVDLTPYNRHIYMFPYRANCPFKSNSTVGIEHISNLSKMWVNGSSDPIVYLHGIGHNFGLFHSHYRNCVDCPKDLVGDRTSVMGSGPGHFNAFEKESLEWMGSRIQTITTSGDYNLDAMESNNTNVKGLKILRQHLSDGTTDYYYIELRKPIGLDARLATCGTSCDYTQGLLIHNANSARDDTSDLIDMRPTEGGNKLVTLLPGRMYIDHEAENGGLMITFNSMHDSTANVNVTFGLPKNMKAVKKIKS